jgi:hypothetical protein
MGALLLRRDALERNGPFAEDVGLAEGLDWLLRARELGLREASVADVVLWRRVHDANYSRGYRGASVELASVLKASLDRRRAALIDRGPAGAALDPASRGHRKVAADGDRLGSSRRAASATRTASRIADGAYAFSTSA